MIKQLAKNIIRLLASKRRVIFVFISLFFAFTSYSQKSSPIVIETIVVNGDTLPLFDIPEVTVHPEFKFTSKKQKRRYSRLVRHVVKVYPYAKLANQKLDSIYLTIDSLNNKKLAKRYIKQVDKELQTQYGDELKKLTITQGRILIKLIDRETGNTSYELVKELRGSFSAFMWQSLARLFGENLKEEYDAEDEDKMIEHIILMIESGRL
jgi:hypothetical protein